MTVVGLVAKRSPLMRMPFQQMVDQCDCMVRSLRLLIPAQQNFSAEHVPASRTAAIKAPFQPLSVGVEVEMLNGPGIT
jgi:hypothetical protein